MSRGMHSDATTTRSFAAAFSDSPITSSPWSAPSATAPSPTAPRSWRSRSRATPGSDGSASTPTSSTARPAPGSSSASCTPICLSRWTPPHTDHCGTCRACIDACPTGAIVAPYRLDARLCISYLTIELHGPIPEHLRPLVGNRIFGCDDCQLVCPWNRFAGVSAETDFDPRHGLDAATLADLFAWSREDYETRTRGMALRRLGYERWLRNIAVALGNAPSTPAVTDGAREPEAPPVGAGAGARRMGDVAPPLRHRPSEPPGDGVGLATPKRRRPGAIVRTRRRCARA